MERAFRVQQSNGSNNMKFAIFSPQHGDKRCKWGEWLKARYENDV